jgi:hypothetical protein
MPNEDIRNEILGTGLRLWQVAEKMGFRDDSFSRKLRKEFTDEQKAEIRKILANLINKE